MNTHFHAKWRAGIHQVAEASTEQAAFTVLVNTCAQLAEVPAIGLLHSHTGRMTSISAHPAPDSDTSERAIATAAEALEHTCLVAENGIAYSNTSGLTMLLLSAAEGQHGAICWAAEAAIPSSQREDVIVLVQMFTRTVQGLRRQAEMQLLASLEAMLGSTSAPGEILKQVRMRLHSLFLGAVVRMFLLDERAGELVHIDGTELDLQPGKGTRIPLAGTLVSDVVQRQQSVLYSRQLNNGIPLAIHEAGIIGGSAICLPLRFSSRIVGALMLVYASGGPQFCADDLCFLRAVVGLISVLIANGRLYVRAVRDALTGAYNRGAFDSALQEVWARVGNAGGDFALILLDLDNFKQINDRFGHLIGDQVLKTVTRILWETLRTDDIIFRYGGEEFCVLLTNVVEVPVVMAIAERLRAALDKSLLINGLVHVPVSASLGVALYPFHHAQNPRDLLDMADDAAYRAKRDGKNRVVLASVPEVHPAS